MKIRDGEQQNVKIFGDLKWNAPCGLWRTKDGETYQTHQQDLRIWNYRPKKVE